MRVRAKEMTLSRAHQVWPDLEIPEIQVMAEVDSWEEAGAYKL